MKNEKSILKRETPKEGLPFTNYILLKKQNKNKLYLS
jgi:hypothetical protein